MRLVGVKGENMKKIVIAIAALQACGILSAAALTCYEEPRTNAYQCFDKKQVREKDGIRSATLYTGGPNGVDKTSFTINVNCGTQIVHLKDRQGVSFAGGYGSETEALKSLRTWICEAKPITATGKK